MNEELTEAKYDAAVEEIVNIVPAVMEQLVAITDKNNIDLILCLVKLISTIAAHLKPLMNPRTKKVKIFVIKALLPS